MDESETKPRYVHEPQTNPRRVIYPVIVPFIPVIGQIWLAMRLLGRLREEFQRLRGMFKRLPSPSEVRDLAEFWREHQDYFYLDPEVCARLKRFARAAAAISLVFLGSATLGAIGGNVVQVLAMGVMGLLFAVLSVFLNSLTRDKGSQNE